MINNNKLEYKQFKNQIKLEEMPDKDQIEHKLCIKIQIQGKD